MSALLHHFARCFGRQAFIPSSSCGGRAPGCGQASSAPPHVFSRKFIGGSRRPTHSANYDKQPTRAAERPTKGWRRPCRARFEEKLSGIERPELLQLVFSSNRARLQIRMTVEAPGTNVGQSVFQTVNKQTACRIASLHAGLPTRK